jgi:NAD-dependent deacetylase
LLQYCRPGVPIYLIDPNPVNTNAFQHVKQLQMGASEGMKRLTELLNSALPKETKD